jgi:hypothetical protein
MKMLKSGLIACSLFAAVAHAQSPAPAGGAQQVAQASEQQKNSVTSERRVAAPSKKSDECVAPAGFCNLYFGS